MSVLQKSLLNRCHLSIVLLGEISTVDDVLRVLSEGGCQIQSWRVETSEWPGQLRLILSIDADLAVLEGRLSACSCVRGYDLVPLAETATFELALVTVRANGRVQDNAASIVASAGGRLIGLDSQGFTAQVSNRPDKIESMIRSLQLTAPFDLVRSGALSIPKA